jgi:type IV pilus assembly protein PilX
MRKITELHRNEEGFILVVGMSILVVLTLLGVSATRNSVIDLKIAGNEREMAEKFYVADTTWKVGGLWLNDKPTAPDIINVTPKSGDNDVDLGEEYYAIVRNFGDGDDGHLNDDFVYNPADPNDDPPDGNYQNIDYWYRVIYNGDTIALKYGEGFRDFKMGVQSIADGSTGIETRMYKVYRVGY